MRVLARVSYKSTCSIRGRSPRRRVSLRMCQRNNRKTKCAQQETRTNAAKRHSVAFLFGRNLFTTIPHCLVSLRIVVKCRQLTHSIGNEYSFTHSQQKSVN